MAGTGKRTDTTRLRIGDEDITSTGREARARRQLDVGCEPYWGWVRADEKHKADRERDQGERQAAVPPTPRRKRIIPRPKSQ
jgi:hypothetical protein